MDLSALAAFSLLAPIQRRQEILRLQEQLEQLPSVLDACEVQHSFAPGQYVRTMYIPKGTLIVGKIHRHAHNNIVSAGLAVVLTEWGVEVVSAFQSFVSPVGCKRVVLALEDVVWSTVHTTDSTDLVEIEQELIAPDYDAIELVGEYKEVT